MVRKLLATTALASILATGALAQGAPAPEAGTAPAASSPSNAAAGAAPNEIAAAPAEAAGFDYLMQLEPDQHLSDDLVGSSVYLSAASTDEAVADIQDLVVAADGTVVAVVIATTDALGESGREVAVPFDRFDWIKDENGEVRVMLTADPQEIASAPSFAYEDAAATATQPAGAPTSEPTAMTAAPAPVQGGTAAGGELAQANPAGPAGAASGEYLASLQPEQYLADELVGNDVHSGPTTESDNIGSINNLVVNAGGTLAGVVVGVGGFLGIGEKDVGVPFDAIEFGDNEKGEQHASLAVSREQLEAAPALETEAANAPAADASTGGMAAPEQNEQAAQ